MAIGVEYGVVVKGLPAGGPEVADELLCERGTLRVDFFDESGMVWRVGVDNRKEIVMSKRALPPKVLKRRSRTLARLTRKDIEGAVGRGGGLLSGEVSAACGVIVDELVDHLSVGGEVYITGLGTLRGLRSGHGVRFQMVVSGVLHEALNREEFLKMWEQLGRPNELIDFKSGQGGGEGGEDG